MVAIPGLMEVDDATFEREVLAEAGPVLVDFGAPWCGPCRALAPIVARFSSEAAGRVKVVTMDTDACPRTVQRYAVRAVPTLVVFRNGERAATHLGVASKEKLNELVARG